MTSQRRNNRKWNHCDLDRIRTSRAEALWGGPGFLEPHLRPQNHALCESGRRNFIGCISHELASLRKCLVANKWRAQREEKGEDYLSIVSFLANCQVIVNCRMSSSCVNCGEDCNKIVNIYSSMYLRRFGGTLPATSVVLFIWVPQFQNLNLTKFIYTNYIYRISLYIYTYIYSLNFHLPIYLDETSTESVRRFPASKQHPYKQTLISPPLYTN